MDHIFRNLLIISECKDIRLELAKWCEYILFVTQNYMSIWKRSLYYISTKLFTMDGISSFSGEYSMVSGYHNRHTSCDLLWLWEIELVPRVENIKSTKTHDMFEVFFWWVFGCIFDAIFRIWMVGIGEWHNTKRSQIGEKCCIWTQKVHNFEKSFDNR